METRKPESWSNNNSLVAKDNIFVTRASYRLKVREQRIVLTLVSRINSEDDDFKRYTFEISELYKLLGLKRENLKIRKKILENALESLQSNVIKIITDENPDYIGREILMMSAWIESPIFDWDKDLVTLRVSEILKPYLLRLKDNFACYSLAEVARFKCAQSFRFLEFCRVHNPRAGYHDQVIDGRYIVARVFELSSLRKTLGIPADIYPRITDFRKRIMEPARKEVNTYTQTRFDFEMVKTVRTVTAVRLIIYGDFVSAKQARESENPAIEQTEEFGDPDESLRRGMAALGVPADFQNIILSSKYDQNQIRVALEAVGEYQRSLESRGGKLSYPRHAFEKALLDGWISTREAERRLEKQKNDEKLADAEAAKALREGFRQREAEKEAQSLAEDKRRVAQYQERLEVEREEYAAADDKTGYILDLLDDYDTLSLQNWEYLRGVVQVLVIENADFDIIRGAAVRSVLEFWLPG